MIRHSSRPITNLNAGKKPPRMIWVLGLACLALSAPATLYASSKTPGKVIAGWVEKITLPNASSSKLTPIKAKLDTGAETSSIHAEDIKTFRRGGKRWVEFTLVLRDSSDKILRIAMKKANQRRIKIKNRDGSHDRRPIVELDICFDGRTHSTQFSLADRSEFIYPILLGRKFLEGIAVVDPQATFLTLANCS